MNNSYKDPKLHRSSKELTLFRITSKTFTLIITALDKFSLQFHLLKSDQIHLLNLPTKQPLILLTLLKGSKRENDPEQ